MKTAYITHPHLKLHNMGDGHPESPLRLSAIEDRLKQDQLYDFLKYFEARKATLEEVKRVHISSYLDYLKQHSPSEGWFEIDGDTAMNPHTLEAAYLAAGANAMAVDLIMKGEIENAFCAVRPPGHHAEHNKAMGFSFINNIAVAAAHALTYKEIKKVAIIDFDVHHGNGTEDIFKNNPNVLILSSFQHPFYPFQFFKQDCEHICNVTLAPGTDSHEFRELIDQHWWPKLHQFKPDFIFISAGFDAHHRDPLAHINLTDQDYRWLTDHIVSMATQYAKNRVVSTLEGGYDLTSLASSCSQHIRALMKLS